MSTAALAAAARTLASSAASLPVGVVCLALVPASHALGLSSATSSGGGSGGNRHLALQAASWLMWALAVLGMLPLLAPGKAGALGSAHVDAVAGAGAAVAFVSEVLMLLSLLAYERGDDGGSDDGGSSDDGTATAAAAAAAAAPRPPPPRPSPLVASAVAVVLGALACVCGAGLLAALEWSCRSAWSRAVYAVLSLSCFGVGAGATHGLGGHLRHHRRQHRRRHRRQLEQQQQQQHDSSSSNDGGGGGGGGAAWADADALEDDEGEGGGGGLSWAFCQPFVGGSAFVVTQAISWTLFAASLLLLASLLQRVAAGVVSGLRDLALTSGSLALLAHTGLAASLALYEGAAAGAADGAGARLARAAAGALISRATTGRAAASSAAAAAAPLPAAKQRLRAAAAAARAAFDVNGPILFMYAPAHALFALWGLSFVVLPAPAALACWAAVLAPYYALTSRGRPELTGCRQWPRLQAWFGRSIEGALVAWFGRVEVVVDGGGEGGGGEQQQGAVEPLPERLIFGFSAHSYYPTGAGFLPWLSGFARAFPGPRPITLVATALFLPPGLREVATWSGFRSVSRQSFVRALRERGRVIFCPGGQAELAHAWRAFAPRTFRPPAWLRPSWPRRPLPQQQQTEESAATTAAAAAPTSQQQQQQRRPRRQELVLSTRHKGFCRFAIQERAALVPVLALGEGLQLRNLVDAPALLAWSTRRLGVPLPFVLVGRYGLTPLPRRTPLVYVVGRPIAPPPAPPAGEPVADAGVDALHASYYAALAGMFERHKHRHPELAGARLVLTAD